jgi:hypothetical protein
MFSGMFSSLTAFRKYGKYVLLALVLGGSFYVGRCTAPTKTVTQTVTVKEQIQSKTTENQEIKTQVQYVDRPVDHVITKIIVREPSGKTTETVTDATHEGNTVVNKTKDAETQVKTETKTEIVYKDKIVEKLVLKDSFKRWEVGADLGYQVLGDSVNIIPTLPKKLVIGASVDYNLCSWLSVGLWGNSSTAVGGKVGVKF